MIGGNMLENVDSRCERRRVMEVEGEESVRGGGARRDDRRSRSASLLYSRSSRIQLRFSPRAQGTTRHIETKENK